ncbi:MAG: ribosomal large subunit pseudouridine synthase D [Porticoccaceae bacterium]|nr:MAG: ribosomal large subunit pseudouridine synthase D [Porticoccaceae bacterium]
MAVRTVERVARTGPEDVGLRLDQVAARHFAEFSRARLQAWIRAGALLVDGHPARPAQRLAGGEQLLLRAILEPAEGLLPEPIPLAVVHCDAEILVLDKPPGLVVHPGAGVSRGTLLNALLHHYPEQALLPRAGIVHRLDKDTSGLLVVARTLEAHQALVRALKARAVGREYLGVVHGQPPDAGTIDAPIGRHPTARTRFAVVERGGREARTHFRVERRFARHALVRVRLETGRTHQIRVHLSHLGHPLVGDPVYGGRRRTATADDPLAGRLRAFRRQALHAERLEFDHPASGARLSFHAPPPPDLRQLLAALEADQWGT